MTCNAVLLVPSFSFHAKEEFQEAESNFVCGGGREDPEMLSNLLINHYKRGEARAKLWD